jgi:large subunit ribosomal protein L14
MIQVGTRVHIGDNSGGVQAECIKVYSGSSVAHVGDTILITLKKVRRGCALKRGEMYKAIVIRTKVGVRRRSGIRIQFLENAVALLSTTDTLIGSRLSGEAPIELRKFNQLRLLAIADQIV